MTAPLRRLRLPALFVAAALHLSQSGCSRLEYRRSLPDPLSEEQRARLGRVVVRTDLELYAESKLIPMISNACGAMGNGILVGFAVGLNIGAQFVSALGPVSVGGGPFAPLIFLALVAVGVGFTAVATTLGMLIGCAWGLSKAPASETLERVREALEGAALESRLAERIRNAVLEDAPRETDSELRAWSPGIDADTLLLISGPRVVLHGPWKFDAPLRLHSEIDVSVISLRNGSLLHRLRLGTEGSERDHEQLAAVPRSALIQELGEPRHFAARILEEIFVLHVIPPRLPPQVPSPVPVGR